VFQGGAFWDYSSRLTAFDGRGLYRSHAQAGLTFGALRCANAPYVGCNPNFFIVSSKILEPMKPAVI
jgi:hypothetical protein